jgi:hypothetical protein
MLGSVRSPSNLTIAPWPRVEGLNPSRLLFLRSSDSVPMYLAKDYTHPYDSAGVQSRCRIRLYLPYEDTDAAVVICSELPDNPGASVKDTAEQIAAEIIVGFRLPAPPVWIEHHPPESTSNQDEKFELLVFAHYNVQKGFRRGSFLHKKIGPPTRKPLDRKIVEMLVRHQV